MQNATATAAATTLVVDLGGDRPAQVTPHPNAAEARRQLIRTARRMRRAIDGNGRGGVLRDPAGEHVSLGYHII